MCQFPCERYCEVQLGIALLVHQRCHLDGLFNDVLLVWSVTLQLQSDIVSYLGNLRVWFIPFPGLRLEQMVIEDDPIDEDCNGFDELGIADADSDTAFIVGAVPALSNAVLHADAALHRLTAVVAPDEVSEQVDGIVFLFAGIALPRRFQADRCFIYGFIYDGVVFFSPNIFSVVDDSCDTGFIPCGGLLCIWDLAAGQFFRDCLERSAIQICLKDISDDFSFLSGYDRPAISHRVPVWDVPYLFHGRLLYAFSESKPAKEFYGHFVLFIDLDGLHNFQKELLIECVEGFFQFEDEHF